MGTPTPFDDAERLRALRDYQVLDTPPEAAFDNITHLAAQMFGAPIALVSLVDEARQWFKSRVGIDDTETPRSVAFCDHAIREQSPLVVADATADPRFVHNPLVTGTLGVRFYCGVPLRTPEGHALGTLCIIDRVPRTIDAAQLESLQALAHQVELELEFRRRVLLLEAGLERQERHQRSRELLAAMLVHDLRTPLAAVSLSAGVLAGLHPESRELLDELLSASETMRRMLTDVLDICLAETAALKPRRTVLALMPAVDQVTNRMRGLAEQRRQELRIELSDRALMVDADPDLLDRMLTNLVGNAIHHGPAGKPIVIRARDTVDTVRIEVCDLGATIAAESRDVIFRAHERLDVAGAQWSRGFGLGLAFCRLAAEAHGGVARVEPGAPSGNCFYFELPRTPRVTGVSG